MTTQKEIIDLIEKARSLGATVNVTYSEKAKLEEGRDIIQTVQISGLRGCGPHPMAPIAAAEILRTLVTTNEC